MTRKTIPNSQSAICNLKSPPFGEVSPSADAIRSGSAIILAIVLTTLLAMIGVLFLLSSRVDSVATSAVGDNQDLKLAVDTVVSQISEVLTRDVPGVDPNGTYYDYPDDFNPWLASLEPNDLGVWPHITDLYYPYQLGALAYNLPPGIIYDHDDQAGNSTPISWSMADADGDGASDSMWVQVPGKMSAKGKPIYAAIRIIDNGGMLNVNTAYKFAPNSSVGSTQLDINLMALAWRPNNLFFPYDPNAENTLRLTRNPSGLPDYENDVIWRYGLPNGDYTPFDISDELEMRYRFVIDQRNIHTRLESWSNQFDSPGTSVLWEPFDNTTSPSTPPQRVPKDWRTYAHYDDSSEPNYAYRHIATTYNCDRIINPNGQKMFNINSPLNFNKNLIYNTVREILDPCVFSSIDVALITANLMDYVDGNDYPAGDPRYDPNNEVTEVNDPCTGTLYYGFERPCVYISEIARNFYSPDANSPYYDANNPSAVYTSYAIELFKPYWEDDPPDPNKWRIVTYPNEGADPIYDYIIWTGSRRFHVLYNNPNAAMLEVRIPIDLNEFPGPNEVNFPDPCHLPQTADINFGNNTTIYLQRNINGSWIPVDWVPAPPTEVNGIEPNMAGFAVQSFERDITLHRCIRNVWNPMMADLPSLGYMNRFIGWGDMIQAHPANKTFTNVGEIGQLFRTDAYLTNEFSTEAEVRLNIADANFQNLFRYLTVMDPNELRYGGHQDNEYRIKGRININTAPWFVLAQLPWVSYHTQPNYDLARSIVNNRDTYGAFKSTGELMRVINSFNDSNSMSYYQGKGNTIPTTLLTPTDGVGDAFEERDVIFDRISNLITVRSDVFTAYILVRVGPSGPQKRVIAILDRSGVTPTTGGYTGKVKVIAVQQVPDPR